MSYASIEEAYGIDFANQINIHDSFNKLMNNMNPYTNSPQTNPETLNMQMQTNTKTYGNKNKYTKKEKSKRDRMIHQKFSEEITEPFGFNHSVVNYKKIENSPCQNFFYHLDTCPHCQKKLKQRVLKYFASLQKNNLLLPGASGLKISSIDKELFNNAGDSEEQQLLDLYPTRKLYDKGTHELEYTVPDPEQKKSTKIEESEGFTEESEGFTEESEGFTEESEGFVDLGNDYTPAFFLLFFGLFVIFSLDKSRSFFKRGGLGNFKIIR
jgi:hypothetical protein